MKWTTKLTRTTFDDPASGEPLYVFAKVRPRWYWRLRRSWLFFRIVWRDFHGARIGLRTAWAVACIIFADELDAPAMEQAG